MSAITSDISRKSNSRIFLTTLSGRDAVGLKGPGAWSWGGLVWPLGSEPSEWVA